MARAATGAGMRLGGVDGVHTFEVDLSRRSTGRLGLDVTLVSVEQEVGLVVEDVNSGGAVELWNHRVHESRQIRAGDIIIRVNGAEGDAARLAAELRSGSDVRLTVQRPLAEDARLARRARQEPHTHLAFGRGQGGQQRAEGHPGPGGFPLPWAAPGHPAEAAAAAWPPGQAAEPRQGLLRKALEGAPMPHAPAAAPGQPSPAAEDSPYTFDVTLIVPEGVRLGIDVLPTSVNDTQALSVKKISAGGAVHNWNQTSPERLRIRAGDCIVCVNGVLSDLPRMLEELRSRRELRFLMQRHPQRTGGPVPAQAQQPPGSAQTQGWGAAPPGPAPHPAPGVPAPAFAGQGAPGRVPAPREPDGPRGGGYGGGAGGGGACGGPPARQPDGGGQAPLPGGLGLAEGPGQRLRFEVEVERTPGVPLGINVMPVVDGGVSRLMVERVATNGSVHAWNLLNWASRQVQAGDLIAQVNGVGLLERMAEEFNREAPRVRFTLERPSTQQGASGPGQQPWAGGARQQPPPGPRGRQGAGGADAAAADAVAGPPARGPPAPGVFAARPPARGPAPPAHVPAAAPRAAQQAQARPGAGLGAPQQQHHHQPALQPCGGADATTPWEGGAPRAPAFPGQPRAAAAGGSLAEAVSAMPPPRAPPGGPGGRPKAPAAPPPELLALQRLAKGAGPASLDAETRNHIAWRAAAPQANNASQPGSWSPEEAEVASAGWAPSAPRRPQANGASQPSPWPSDEADVAAAGWAPSAPRRPQAGAGAPPGAVPPATALARPAAAAAPAAGPPRPAAPPPAARAGFGGAAKDPSAAAALAAGRAPAPPAARETGDPDASCPPGLPAAGGGEAEASDAGAAGLPEGGGAPPKALLDDTGGVVLPSKEAHLLRSAMLLPDDELVRLLQLTLETRPSICDQVAETVGATAAPEAGQPPEGPAGAP